MSSPSGKLLESARSCVLLHHGGEADVYLLKSSADEKWILKWYSGTFQNYVLSVISRIKDDGICPVREYGIIENHHYQLYDFVDGVTSEGLVFPVVLALTAMRQLVSSLKKAAKEGVSHGDLNPSNVIFSIPEEAFTKGKFQTVLMDWGIVGPGALAFAAPERFQGKKPDEKSDVFSLGMLLYHWLCGKNLVDASGIDDYVQKVSLLDVQDISRSLLHSFSATEIAALEPVWKLTLQFDPENRAEDLEELDEVLEIALDEIGGGSVSGSIKLKQDLKSFLSSGKMEQKLSMQEVSLEEVPFPYKKKEPQGNYRPLKIAILGIAGLFILGVVLFVLFGTESSPVDETGSLILKNSRNVEMDAMEYSSSPSDSLEPIEPAHKLLKDLPLPSKE